MDTIRELYKIGRGPSSSHTMGPAKAAMTVLEKFPNADHFIVELWGSLAATGKGHLTDWIIIETLKPRDVEIIWKPNFVHEFHTNGLRFIAFDSNNQELGDWIVFSVGGGTIKGLEEIGEKTVSIQQTYPHRSLEAIMERCKENNKELWEYIEYCEGKEIWDFLRTIYQTMNEAIQRGLANDGVLPGPLKLKRRAKEMYENAISQHDPLLLTNKMFAYALAVGEENANGGVIVTAPTCGSSGVIPGMLKAMEEAYHLSEEQVLRGLAIGGLIGNLIKHNATISGAEGGCQAEIGSACSMASAMAVYFLWGSIEQIEYAAESGLEHHLGMTCDPVGGFVQIPCIERNAIVSTRSLNTALYCMSTDGSHTISFDEVVQTMLETGRDICSAYRETSLWGLAKYYEKKILDEDEKKKAQEEFDEVFNQNEENWL